MNIARIIAQKFGYELEKPKIIELTLRTHLNNLFQNYEIDLVFDVGANKGQFAKMLRANGYQGLIYSIEPGSVAFNKLKATSRSDAKWKAYNLALGADSCEVTISISERDRLASLHKFSEFGKLRSGKASKILRQERVEMITLDEFIKRESISISKHNCFLKIDTQGHDFEVFKGAQLCISSLIGLQTEISLKSIYEHVPPYGEVLGFCQQKGFNISGLYAVDRDGTTLELIEVDCVMVKP
ncbi:MAG: FkbM family methyltransferase [Gammaproteobacteria bacterium]|nr:MAG: FkbM family methyltransferase [Gammaproteobacteria bacterium]